MTLTVRPATPDDYDAVGHLLVRAYLPCGYPSSHPYFERLRREASLARNALGYAPSLLLSVDGRGLAQVDRDEEDRLIASVDAAVPPDIADDMVAVLGAIEARTLSGAGPDPG